MLRLGRTAIPIPIPMRQDARDHLGLLDARDHPQLSRAADGRLALRDRTMQLFLYNTGDRVSEVAGLRVDQLSLTTPAHLRLLGKGGKRRSCPQWNQTAQALQQLLAERGATRSEDYVFAATTDEAMTRFGIDKRVRRLVGALDEQQPGRRAVRHITPHVFRHTTAVHLLEAGVEVNVILGWLGHVSLETTHRYAEITVPIKPDALSLCEPVAAKAPKRKPVWHDDAELKKWLASL